MKHLEQMILGACYGEENVHRVSFLRPSDFTDNGRAVLFREILEYRCVIEAIKRNPQMKNNMIGYSLLMGTYKPESFALKLLEYSFQRSLKKLLVELSGISNNPLEVNILDEAITKINTADVFDLSDYLLEYLGYHASSPTKYRINAFLSYRNERIEEVKNVIDNL